MERSEYIKRFCDIYDNRVYVSGVLLYEGDIDDCKVIDFLARYDITQVEAHRSQTPNVGRSLDGLWYAWEGGLWDSFGIGSVVTMDDLAYHPSNREEYYHYVIRYVKTMTRLGNVNSMFADGRYIRSFRMFFRDTEGNMRYMSAHYPLVFGRGEWVAETGKDARAMACDFVDGVRRFFLHKENIRTLVR